MVKMTSARHGITREIDLQTVRNDVAAGDEGETVGLIPEVWVSFCDTPSAAPEPGNAAVWGVRLGRPLCVRGCRHLMHTALISERDREQLRNRQRWPLSVRIRSKVAFLKHRLPAMLH